MAPTACLHVNFSAPTTSATCFFKKKSAYDIQVRLEFRRVLFRSIIVNCASVTITKVADQGTVNAGDTIGYAVTVTNTGAGTAHNVTVSDTLPSNSGLSWSIDAGATTGSWTITTGGLHFGPVDLAPSASFHVHITSPTTSATCGTVNISSMIPRPPRATLLPYPTPFRSNCAGVTITKVADQG